MVNVYTRTIHLWRNDLNDIRRSGEVAALVGGYEIEVAK